MSQTETPFRLDKSVAINFAVTFTPLYAGIFAELKANGERLILTDRFALVRQRIGSYVRFYDNEAHIGVAMMNGLLGEDCFRELNEESKDWTHQQKIDFIEFVVNPENLQQCVDDLDIPETEDEWKAAELAASEMGEEERGRSVRRGAIFFGSIFAQLLNMFALMVHGAKMTTLVKRAMSGDQDAFIKAVQVDRVLLTHHPFFISRKRAAQDSLDVNEAAFLRRLAAHETKPQLRGRIRYPGLYFLFHTLESVGWLHELTDEELLDICDEAGLDRWQNRIEDVNYLTKRRLEFLRWQETGAVSMH